MKETIRRTILYCHERTGRLGDPKVKYFFNFYPRVELVQMCEGPRKESQPPIFKVRVSKVKEFKDCYWGWWDNEDRAFTLVFPSKNLIEICFPYGTKGETKRGRGWVLPVMVEKISRVKAKAI